MRKIKKMIIAYVSIMCTILTTNITVFAESTNNECIYDIATGGTQTFTLRAPSDNIVYITISEIPLLARSLRNGTYKVSYTSPRAWEAGYNLVIQNNQIKSVNSPYYVCYKGIIHSSILKKDSSLQATMSFIYKIGGLNISTGIRTKIVNKEIKVSIL